MDQQKERRTMERQRCNCKVNWSYFNKKSILKGLILNFCQEGSYIETAKPLIPVVTVQIRVLECTDLMLEHEQNPRFNAIAEVKWCREVKNINDSRYGVGLRYHYGV